MNYNMKKIVSLVLVLVILLTISVPAFAAKKSISTSDGSKISEISTQIKDISRDDFLKNLAKQQGISLAQADEVDKNQTQSDYQQEVIKHSASDQILGRSLSPQITNEIIYRQVTKTFNTGSSGSFWSQVVVVIQVKIARYYSSSFGTYQKFTQVLDLGADSYGSGSSTWNTIAQSADITGDTGYENKLVMMLSGNVEIAVSYSLQASAGAAGFTMGYSVGGTDYYRKFVQINYTFSSNYDLS